MAEREHLPDLGGLKMVPLCELCRGGAGGECHTPGCALWMNRAPDAPIQYDDEPALPSQSQTVPEGVQPRVLAAEPCWELAKLCIRARNVLTDLGGEEYDPELLAELKGWKRWLSGDDSDPPSSPDGVS